MSIPFVGNQYAANDRLVLSLWRGLIERRITMRRIAGEIAERHGMGLPDICGVSRVRSIVRVRQEAMWALRRCGRFSTPQIGRFLGDRDHTTIIYGVRAHEARLAEAGAL